MVNKLCNKSIKLLVSSSKIYFVVTWSTNQREKEFVHIDPKFAKVLRKVMYVPPITGSLILAKNAIIATNMAYTVALWTAETPITRA